MINAAGVGDAAAYKKAGSNVYVYYFDFEGPVDKFSYYDDVGLSHGGELPYNFGGYRQRTHQSWEHEVGDFINLKLK